ncbi:hypothetical protein FAGKG844_250007 [Frankia sp. AgKG'84/4]
MWEELPRSGDAARAPASGDDREAGASPGVHPAAEIRHRQTCLSEQSRRAGGVGAGSPDVLSGCDSW